jgi:integrase
VVSRSKSSVSDSRKYLTISQLKGGGWNVPGTIIKHDKAWIVVLDHGTDNGKRLRKWKSFASRRDAEAYQAQVATHPTFGAGLGVHGSNHLRVRVYLDQWLRDYAKYHVQPSTFKRYQELVRVHLVPGLGHLPIARLSPQAIETLFRSLQGKISNTTAHHVASLLRESLKQAVRWNLIAQNPADLVDKPRRNRVERLLWTLPQAKSFLRDAHDTRYGLLYMVLLGTGLRLGEALALQWSDLDLTNGILTVRGGKTSNARRAVLMPEELVRELKAVRGVGLVFHRNGKPVNQWTLRDNWYALLERLNLPRIRVHDLRHLHGSFLLGQGADLASVSARLGHSSKAFTLQTYIHTLATVRRRRQNLAANCLPELEFAVDAV